MSERNEGTRARRPYRKPQLEQVQLVAEEAVLAGCKTRTSGNGPEKTPCQTTPGPFCRAPTT